MIDLRNIETFFWVATLGGFRAAAEKLNATQPAISQRIASLESDLGIRLFDRDVRGIKLTGKGRELLSHAERMLQLRRDMQEAARAKSVMSGTLRLGVSETIVHTWLPTLMEYLHDAYPALMVEIQVDTTTMLKTQLASRQIDLAFLLGPMEEPRIENLYLCNYPLSWVASPKLKVGRQPISLKRLGQWPVITYSSTTDPHRAVRIGGGRIGDHRPLPQPLQADGLAPHLELGAGDPAERVIAQVQVFNARLFHRPQQERQVDLARGQLGLEHGGGVDLDLDHQRRIGVVQVLHQRRQPGVDDGLGHAQPQGAAHHALGARRLLHVAPQLQHALGV